MINKFAGGLLLGITGILVLSACAEDKERDRGPNLEPVATVVKTMVPLAYAVSVSSAVVNGDTVAGVTPSNTCSSYPCVATVSFNLSDGLVPAHLEHYGDVYVAGLWSAANQAVMTVVFVEAKAGSGNYPVSKISTIPVTTTASGVSLVYASTDIDIATDPDDSVGLDDQQLQAEQARLGIDPGNDVELAAALDAWVVNVDFQGTPLDFSDDIYTLSGGGQYLGVGDRLAYVYQLGVVDMTMQADCSLNPKSGHALINELEVATGDPSKWPKLGVATLEFHENCDGQAHALLAVGSYGVLADKDIPLGMDQTAAANNGVTQPEAANQDLPERHPPVGPPRL